MSSSSDDEDSLSSTRRNRTLNTQPSRAAGKERIYKGDQAAGGRVAVRIPVPIKVKSNPSLDESNDIQGRSRRRTGQRTNSESDRSSASECPTKASQARKTASSKATVAIPLGAKMSVTYGRESPVGSYSSSSSSSRLKNQASELSNETDRRGENRENSIKEISQKEEATEFNDIVKQRSTRANTRQFELSKTNARVYTPSSRGIQKDTMVHLQSTEFEERIGAPKVSAGRRTKESVRHTFEYEVQPSGKGSQMSRIDEARNRANAVQISRRRHSEETADNNNNRGQTSVKIAFQAEEERVESDSSLSSHRIRKRLGVREGNALKRSELSQLDNESVDPDQCWIGKNRGSNILKPRKKKESDYVKKTNELSIEEGETKTNTSSTNSMEQMILQDSFHEKQSIDNANKESAEGKVQIGVSIKTGQGTVPITSEPSSYVRSSMNSHHVHSAAQDDAKEATTIATEKMQESGQIKEHSLKHQSGNCEKNIHQSSVESSGGNTSDAKRIAKYQPQKKGRRPVNTNILERAQSFELKISESNSLKRDSNTCKERKCDASSSTPSTLPEKLDDEARQRRSSDTDGKIPRAIPARLMKRADTQPKLRVSPLADKKSETKPALGVTRRKQLGPKPSIAEQEEFIRNTTFPGTTVSHEEFVYSSADEINKRSPTQRTGPSTVKQPENNDERIRKEPDKGNDHDRSTQHHDSGPGKGFGVQHQLEHDHTLEESAAESVCSDATVCGDDGGKGGSEIDDLSQQTSTKSSITTEADLEDQSLLSPLSQDEHEHATQVSTTSPINRKKLGTRHPTSPIRNRVKSSIPSEVYAQRIQQWAKREKDQTCTQNRSQKELSLLNNQLKTLRSVEKDQDNTKNIAEVISKELQATSNEKAMTSRIQNLRTFNKSIEKSRIVNEPEEKTPGNRRLGSHGAHRQHDSTALVTTPTKASGFQRSKIYFQTGNEHHRQTELDSRETHLLKQETSSTLKVVARCGKEYTSREGLKESTPAAVERATSKQLEQKVLLSWHSETDTDLSTGEEQLESDSSVPNVVEARRRRLVKRTKKRASRCKKLVKLKGEDYHSIGSASDESGAYWSRASSVERTDDGHKSEDLESVTSENRSPVLSSVGRKFSHPVFSTQSSSSLREPVINESKQAMKSASTSTFPKPFVTQTTSFVAHNSSFDMGSKSDQEGRESRLTSVGKIGGFSSVAKVAKVTIPSIKSFQKTRNFTPPSYSVKRVLSDSESTYASTSMSEIQGYAHDQEPGIVQSPFSFRKYRAFGERYSDDEHELTARLERYEEFDSYLESNSLRRCNTLPRNIGVKYQVKESPFKLNLPSRSRKTSPVDCLVRSLESPGFSNSPFSLKSSEANLLSKSPSRSTGNLDGTLIDSRGEVAISTSINSAKTNQISDIGSPNKCQGSLKTGDLLSNDADENDTTGLTKQANKQYKVESYSGISSIIHGTSTARANNSRNRGQSLSPDAVNGSPNLSPSENFIAVIEPPDNFKDIPTQAEFNIVNDNNNNNSSVTSIGDSLAEQISNFLQDIESEVGLCYEARGRANERANIPTPIDEAVSSFDGISFPDLDENGYYFPSKRGTESPRRRPSYIKAQDSILPNIICPEQEIPGVVPPPPTFELTTAGSEENNRIDTAVDVVPRDTDKRTGDEATSTKRQSKRPRPRIPTVLDNVPSNHTTAEVIEQGTVVETHETPRTGRKEEGGSDSDELPVLDLTKIEKSLKKRSRPVLAVTPILEGIPEEKGGDASRGGKKQEDRADNQAARKTRKSKKQNAQSPTALIEDVLSEGGDERVDSPKTERDDKSETGYYSQSSDLLSTPSQLSIDDIPQDGGEFTELLPIQTKGFRKSRVLEAYKDSEKNGDTLRSKSDPLPDGLSSDETKMITDTINDVEVYSNSEPSLVPRGKVEKESARRAMSNQEVVQRSSPKTSRKDRDRKVSEDSAVDTLSPTNESVSFDSAYESMNSKSQITMDNVSVSAPETPVPAKKHDMRRHVLQNLLETEKSYVQNLNYVVTMVYKPLKKPESTSVIEPQLVDEIFFQIPEILVNHEFFLEQLTNRVNNWHEKQVIGDLFISSFRKCLLMDAYSTFISHYLQARAAVRQAMQARPSFGKFLEQCTKEHKEKLTLQDLMIMPVQRIPRYTLILKDMLKHTDVDHPDYGNLQLAIGEIKTLAERMNKGEMEADQAEREAERLRDIEATIEGVTDLVATNRKFIRQDLVAEVRGVITKKDRCLFLFSDLLLCATVKRKTTALRRGSLGLFSGQSATDFNKYKLLWKIHLEDIELVKSSSNSSLNRRGSSDKQVEKLEEDISILSNISALADTLTTAHQNLDICIRELMADLNKQISERSQVSQTQPPMQTRVEIQVQTDDGIEFFLFVFLSAEIKSSWEAYFEDAKQKLAYSRDTFPPEFQYSMPITKTRSGMQFTCAAPSHLHTHGELHYDQSRGDVWVCNSDGYVGQVCLLAVVPKAEPKAVLSVCSARIQCISPVPGARLVSSTRSPRSSFDTRKLPQIPEVAVPKKNKLSPKLSGSNPRRHKSLPSESEDDDQPPGPETIIAFDSSDEEDGDVSTGFIGGSTVFGGRMSPDGSSLGTAESIEGEHDSSSHDNQSDYGGNDSSEDDDQGRQESSRRISMPIGSAMRRGSHGYTLKGSLDDLLGSDIDEQPTMWLGTEDGSIYVYQANEAATARKSKMKMQLGAAVNAILYVDNRVFVALASGELCVYKRDAGAGWEVATPQTVQVGSPGTPITCIAAVTGRIWCGSQNNVILVNSATLKVEKTLVVSSDPHRSVYKIAGSGLGVWISLQSSAVVRLYHATTLENLTDIDVAPAVHKMLAGADAIIRQHKAACLRVTALLTCKDQLWIGTSAGVILTNPLPTITMNTQSLRHTPGPSGSPHGHTGHVRFLTSVEVPKSQYKPVDKIGTDNSTQSPSSSSKTKQRDSKARANELDNAKTVTLVISGGDGYEDFRSNAASEAVGRDDSTNHLLIWRV